MKRKRIRNPNRSYRLEGLVIDFNNKDDYFPYHKNRALIVNINGNYNAIIVKGDWALALNSTVDFPCGVYTATKKEICEKFKHWQGGVKRIWEPVYNKKNVRVSIGR